MIVLNKIIINDECGQGVVEFGLIISLVVLAAVGALELMGVEVFNLFEFIKAETGEVM